MLLMEKSRAGRHSGSDQSFHVLSRLVVGAEGSLQKELGLDRMVFDNSNPFVSISQKLEEKQKATAEFIRLVQAFEALNTDATAVKAIWMVLASIVHLGFAGVAKGNRFSAKENHFQHVHNRSNQFVSVSKFQLAVEVICESNLQIRLLLKKRLIF